MNKKFFLIPALVALVTGSIFLYLSWNGQPSGDGVGYHNLAVSVLQTQRFAEGDQLTASRDPGYPVFLASVYSVSGISANAVRVVQLILFVAIALLTYKLAYELYPDERSARLGSILVAIAYPLAQHVGLLYSEILFTFLLLASTLFFTRGWKGDRLALYGLSGLIFAGAALTRSLLLYFPVVLLIAFVIFQSGKRQQAFRAAGIFLLFFALAVAPWILRNYQLFGTPAISIRSGQVLYFAVQRMEIPNGDLPRVFVANVFGDYIAQRIYGHYDRYAIEEGDFGETTLSLYNQGLTNEEIDEETSRRALEQIRANPARYLFTVPWIEFLKLHTPIFPLDSAQGLFSDAARYASVPQAAKIIFILGLRLLAWIGFGFIIYGLFRGQPSFTNLAFGLLLIIYLAGSYSLLHGIPRYLLPLYPLYLTLLSFGITRYFRQGPATTNPL